MQVEVKVSGDGQETELRSLHTWLGQDPQVRSSATLSLVERPAGAGAMGGWLDTLQIVTENGWSAASFVMTVVTWRQTRPRPRKVIVRHGGIEVVLTEGTDAEVQQVIELLSQQTPDGIEDDEV
ncbi:MULTISPECIES: effector-associated constant component EACC1 [unclassified Kitasatospora]|uniref:effector-associated constant component EACC1 n=1 Tax=Kitasatospora sp. NPDC056651 TaxID=3345892 RepID=UPI0036ABDA4E